MFKLMTWGVIILLVPALLVTGVFHYLFYFLVYVLQFPEKFFDGIGQDIADFGDNLIRNLKERK